MKVVVVLFVLFGIAKAVQLAPAKDSWPTSSDELVDMINQGDNTWKATGDNRFAGLTIGEAKQFLGLKEFTWQNGLSTKELLRVYQDSMENSNTPSKPSSYPSSFDARKQWPGCVHPVLNQGDCGSCWAFAASEALSDRLCIDSNSSVNVVLSPQNLVSCAPLDGLDFACDGGLTQTAWDYMAESGLVTNNCWPYTSGQDGSVPDCRTTCKDGAAFKKYYADYDSIATYIGEEEIQAALLKGPVEAAFMIFDDFFTYSSGVYVRKSPWFAGLHAIKIIGWGETSGGVKYWICQNSWGTDWGMDGFFYFLRGDNECMIESDVVAGNGKV